MPSPTKEGNEAAFPNETKLLYTFDMQKVKEVSRTKAACHTAISFVHLVLQFKPRF